MDPSEVLQKFEPMSASTPCGLCTDYFNSRFTASILTRDRAMFMLNFHDSLILTNKQPREAQYTSRWTAGSLFHSAE